MKMMHKILISFIILSIIFRFSLININKGYWWDEVVYLGLAKNLNEKLEFGTPPPIESFRPILLPILISIGFRIYENEIIAKVIVLSFSIFSLISIYLLGKELYDEKIGVIATILLGTNHLFLFHAHRIFTEPIFITFYSLSLLFYFKGIEKQNKYLIPAAIFSGLCALTKNFGFLIPFIFLFYFLIRKKFNTFKDLNLYASFLIYILILVPFFYFLFSNYHGIKEFLVAQAGNVPELDSYAGFYFMNFFDVFTGIGFFILAGFYLTLKRKKSQHLFMLISLIIPLIVLHTILGHHKEERYLIPFFPSFFIIASISINALMKKIKKIVLFLLLIFILYSFARGFKQIIEQSNSGTSLINACIFLKELMKSNETIISESYPYVFYFSGVKVIKPPSDKTLFYQLINEKNVSYVLIYYNEKGNPSYLWEELKTDKFEKIKGFNNEKDIEETAIFKYRR